MAEKKVHEGRNIKRFREMLGIKQDALAWELGEDWNQQKVSLLEQRERVDEPILRRIAEVLKIPVDALKNFDEGQAINIIANTFGDYASFNHQGVVHFHPMEKILQLHDEKLELYRDMLKEKDEMIIRLEKLLENNT